MKKILVLPGLLFLIFTASGQILGGIVIEKGTESPLSYVSIGLINKPGGTYSDTDGKFQFSHFDYDKNDSLRFSCIGYKSVTILLNKPIEEYAENKLKVYMEKEIFRLKGVEIFPKEYRLKEIGNKISNKHICICGSNDVEGGIIIHNKKKLFLDKLTFRLSEECTQMPDSILFRINVYHSKNDLPADILLREPIYYLLKKEHNSDQVTVDLEKYRITVTADFAVTLEIIKVYGTGKICYAGWVSGNPTVFKNGKQSKWTFPVDDKKRRVKIYQSMSINARVER